MDVKYAMDYIEREGPQYGCNLSPSKNRFITSVSGKPPRSPEYSRHRGEILEVVRRYGKESDDRHSGGVILGQPFGTSAVTEGVLDKCQKGMEEIVRLLRHTSFNPQVALRLYRMCIVQKAFHLLRCDLLNQDLPRPDRDHFPRTPWTQRLSALTDKFLDGILDAGEEGLPKWSYTLAKRPISKCGLGLFDPTLMSFSSLLGPTARCIQWRLNSGHLPIHKDLEPSFREDMTPDRVDLSDMGTIWKNWDAAPEETHMLLNYFRVYSDMFVAEIPEDVLREEPDIEEYQHIVCSNLKKELPRLRMELEESLFKERSQNFHPEVKARLYQLHGSDAARTLITAPFATRRHIMEALTFQMVVKRMLRAPLLDSNDIECPCGRLIDAEGDHFFSCVKFPKKGFSDTIRDALWTICRGIGPYFNIDYPTQDVDRETPGLLLSNPQIRPGDVTILNGRPPHRPRVTFIDVTITKVLEPPPDTASDVKEKYNSQRLQFEEAENIKFSMYNRTGGTADCLREMNRNGHALIPFAMDPFGNLGPFARQFLFGHKPEIRYSHRNDSKLGGNQEAYNLLTYSSRHKFLRGITKQADTEYLQRTEGKVPFCPGSTISKPSSWAKSHLAINTFHAMGKHLRRSLAKLGGTIASRNTKCLSMVPLTFLPVEKFALPPLETAVVQQDK